MQASAEKADSVVAVEAKVEKETTPVLAEPSGLTPLVLRGPAEETGAAAEAENETSAVLSEPGVVDAEIRNRMIAEAAYYRAEARGFATGYELEDWLEAQAEVDRSLRLSDLGPEGE
jgi:hypothetical protein